MTEVNVTFEMAQQNDKTINHEILPRLKAVEQSQEEITKEMAAMRQSQTSLELTMMKESQTTRQQVEKMESTLTTQNAAQIKQSENLFDIVKASLGIQSTRTTQKHEFKMAKWNHVATILVKFGGGITLLLGSGTALAMIIDHYFGK